LAETAAMMSSPEEVAAVERAEERLMEMEMTKGVVDVLAYQVRGSLPVPSYLAVRSFIAEMSFDGHAMEYLKDGEPELVEVDGKSTWKSFVKMRNKKTGHESTGVGEMAASDGEFASRKAHSKAVRNAMFNQVNLIAMRMWIAKKVKAGGGTVQAVKAEPKEPIREMATPEQVKEAGELAARRDPDNAEAARRAEEEDIAGRSRKGAEARIGWLKGEVGEK